VKRRKRKAVQERTGANLREITAEIRASNETFEVLQGTLVSRMDIQAMASPLKKSLILRSTPVKKRWMPR
jgi:hypothetical protein